MLWENSWNISRYWKEEILDTCMDEAVFDLSFEICDVHKRLERKI